MKGKGIAPYVPSGSSSSGTIAGPIGIVIIVL